MNRLRTVFLVFGLFSDCLLIIGLVIKYANVAAIHPINNAVCKSIFMIFLIPFTARYVEKAIAIIAISTGTQRLAAAILSFLSDTCDLMNQRNNAAITPPNNGDITHDAAIWLIFGQLTAENPAAAIPAPITPPTTECVVDTGAPTQVAKLTHNAAEINAANIAQIKISGSPTADGSMIPFDIVPTTSPPAKSAPALSKIAAIISAPVIESALAPTAGPTLLATSFAPIFKAI